MRLATGIALAILALDQALKWWIVVGLDLATRLYIEVLPPFLTLTMAWNRGINFGLFAGDAAWQQGVLIALSLAISGWVWLWTRREGAPRPMQIATGLLVGGALGNVVDRAVWGAVADFLNVTCCGLRNPWAFNVADIAIFVGAFGLIVTSGRKKDG